MALTTNLISFWQMDEVSGSRFDSHGSNTLTDSHTSPRNAGLAGNYCVNLTIPSNLSCGTNASLETGDIDWTIAGWTIFNAWTAYYTIVSKYPATENQREYVLFYNHGIDKLELDVRKGDDSGYASAISTVIIPASDANWHFYVIGHDATVANQIFISIDNETLVPTANPTGMHVGNGNFVVGGDAASPGDLFDGWADQIGFWKRTLTLAERTWIYNSGLGRTYAEIVTGMPDATTLMGVILM